MSPDYSALDDGLDRAALARFRANRAALGWGRAPKGHWATLVFLAVILLITTASGIAVIVFLGIPEYQLGRNDPVWWTVGGAYLILISAMLFVTVRTYLKIRPPWVRWWRLSRFAAQNGFTFAPSYPDPRHPGSIFQQGSERTATDEIVEASRRELTIGNYSYLVGGRHKTRHDWGYLAIRLERALPHMVLDSRRNNHLFGVTNLPTDFRRDQTLSLEGDFDRHFRLYCPREYERDALYVFTPDLMALLIDEAAPYDVEIVDDWLFVYSPRPFDPLSRAGYERLFRIADTVGAKTLDQTDRYADDRPGSYPGHSVAMPGRRLTVAFPTVAVLLASLGLVWWVVSVVGEVMERVAG